MHMADQPVVADGNGIRRLVLCFDGTWNTPEDQTNVSRIYAAIADVHAGCKDQLKFYDTGVGTNSGSRVTGAAFGWGLDENILQGYCWLINEYQPLRGVPPRAPEADGEVFETGPDIFIFGFSRGAYTARSLAGLINRCGLPRRELFAGEVDPATGRVEGRAHTKSTIVRRAWELYREKFAAGIEGRRQPPLVAFRRDHSRNVKVRFLGVWDTVGALGVPMFSNNALARLRYGFHDTGLGRVVECAYHAVAIDEQREDYEVTLWDRKHEYTRDVEQRWFPGAHTNVGGGYQDDLLPDPPLKWIAEKAIAEGLEFTDEVRMRVGELRCKRALPEDFKLRGNEYLSPVRDSYAEFLLGIYRIGRALRPNGGRYYRPMLVRGVGETIDESAHMKWSADHAYRPPNFAYAGRADMGASAAAPVAVTAGRTQSGAA